MTLGLVLSGGGVRGFAHLGVLKALHEEKIRPQMISGTSAGSIVAGLYAYGYEPDEIALLAKKISRRCYDVDFTGIICAVLNVVMNEGLDLTGLIKGDILENFFHQTTRGAKLKEAKIPLAITAVDINNAHIIIFSSFARRLLDLDEYVYLHNYTFAEAIRSSIAIPGIFKPKIINKMRLVDGGVRANLPVEVIQSMGARRVIAVNLGYTGYPVPGVDNIVEISMQSLDLMIYQITKPSMASADIIITPYIDNVKHSDLSKLDYMIQCGYKAAKEAMPRIKQMLCLPY